VNRLWPMLLHEGPRERLPELPPVKRHPTLGFFTQSERWVKRKRGGSQPDIERGKKIADCIAQRLADRSRTWPQIASTTDLTDAKGHRVTGKRLTSEASLWARRIGVMLPRPRR